MSDLYWLTDDQIERLRPYFPKSHGKPRVNDRRVLSGIVFVDRNGLRWRDAPERPLLWPNQLAASAILIRTSFQSSLRLVGRVATIRRPSQA